MGDGIERVEPGEMMCKMGKLYGSTPAACTRPQVVFRGELCFSMAVS